MHVRTSIACQCIDLVDEDDDLSHFFAELPHLRKASLTLTVVLAHNCLSWDVYKWDIDLLGDNLSTCRLACPWRALEQHCLWSIGLILHTSVYCNLIVYLWVVECQKDSVFY